MALPWLRILTVKVSLIEVALKGSGWAEEFSESREYKNKFMF